MVPFSNSASLVVKLVLVLVRFLLGHIEHLGKYRDQQHCKQIVQSDPNIMGRRKMTGNGIKSSESIAKSQSRGHCSFLASRWLPEWCKISVQFQSFRKCTGWALTLQNEQYVKPQIYIYIIAKHVLFKTYSSTLGVRGGEAAALTGLD